MRGQRRMWKYGRLFLRFLVTLAVLLVATIAALAFVLVSSYERNTLRIIQDADRNLLSQVKSGFESLDYQVREFMSSLSTDPRVITLLLSKDLDIWEIAKTLDAINLRRQASFVESVYIYNANTGEFYTTLGRGIRTAATFFDPDIAAMVRSGSPVEKWKPLPRRIERPAREFGQATTIDGYTYVYCSSRPADGAFPPAIFVNIPVSSVLANLDKLNVPRRGEGSHFFAVARDGRVVADARSSEFLKDASGDPVVRRILASSGESGSFLADVDGVPSVVTWSASTSIGWRFVQQTPYQAFARPLLAQRTLIIAICAAFLGVGLLLAFLFSRMLYLPIGALVSHVKRVISSSESVMRSENEMRFLADAFSHEAEMVKILRRFREDNLRTLRAEFLRSLLAGQCPPDTRSVRLTELGLGLTADGLYYVVACRIDRSPQPRSEGDPHDEVRTYVLERTARVLTGVRFDCETVETDRGLFVMIVCFGAAEEDSAAREAALRDHVRGLQAWARNTLGVSLSASVCGPGHGLESVGALHRRALSLLAYRLVFGRGCLVSSADVEARDSLAFRFPIEEEKRLLDAVRAADIPEARAVFIRIEREVARQQYETIRLTTTRLASSLFDLLTMMEENSTLRFPQRFSEFMGSLDECETLEEVSAVFLRLFDRIDQAQRSQISQKPERNIQAIRDIVERHFEDCTLCTTGIAAMMKMSPVYLGKIFRDQCGQSIFEYLTDVRMAKARELLCNTDCTVKELARKVGIDNPRFLFTKFKERFGATPSQYRLKVATGARQ